MLSNHNKEVHKEFKASIRNKEQLLEELTLNRLQISPVFIFDHSTWRYSSSVKPMARYQQHNGAEETYFTWIQGHSHSIQSQG